MHSTGCPVLLFSLCTLLVPTVRGQERTIDFRYAPAESWTVICLPDDWLKTAVSNSGALLYDFGPGPYARALTSISVGVHEDSLRVKGQSFADPRVPILTTRVAGRRMTIEEHAFAVVPEKVVLPPSRWRSGTIRRTGGMNGGIGWAAPADSVDDAFRNTAWGTNRPIKYAVRVLRGSAKRVALGVIEPYKWGPGARLLELRAEGAPPRVIDPMGDNIRNRPHVLFFDAQDVNRDGWLTIESHAPATSPDANVTLSGFWIFPPHASLDSTSVINGSASRTAEVYHRCGTELEENASGARLDILSSRLIGEGQPFVMVRTRRLLSFDKARGMLRYRGRPYLLCAPAPQAAHRTPEGWQLELPKGTQNLQVLVAHGGGGTTPVSRIPDFRKEMEHAAAYWLKDAPIPRRRITVPDTMVQYLADVNTRVMYQVRDVVDGIPQFQPGPTVYRGLWTGDVCLTGSAILTLGDTSGMRSFLEAALRVQLPSGQIRGLYPAVSLPETPVVVAAGCWYAQTTGNRTWLLRHWPALRQGIRWIESMRRSTLDIQNAPYAGLLPPGFVDGGISVPTADYSSVWWAIIAVDRAADAARWIGEMKDAEECEAVRAAFLPAWERAARLDIRMDRNGMPFLPVGVGDTSTAAPQRGQFALLWPARFSPFLRRPGSLADSVIRMNLRMLDHYARQGIVAGSGWLDGGVWPWLGMMQGTAWTVIGHPERGYDFLYASANHASTAGTWAEEQLPLGRPSRTTGDFADAEASAVFLHLVRLLLATENGDTLHLLRDMPVQWLHAGGRVELDNIITDLGRIHFRLELSPDGRTAVASRTLAKGGKNPRHLRLDLLPLSRAGFSAPDGSRLPERIDIPADRNWTFTMHRPAP